METVDIASLAIAPGSLVLDLGCGEGRHCHASAWHHPNAHTIGFDVNLRDLNTARQRGEALFSSLAATPPAGALGQTAPISYACGDGTRLPFNSETFDTVICSEVLEHIHDYSAMLAEVQRVLKPGGTFAASVPRAWPERLCWRLSAAYHHVEGGHLRIFNAKTLSGEIAHLGFTQQQLYYAHALHSPYWWLRCAFWQRGENALLCRTYHRLLVWDLMKKPWLTRALERLLNPIMGKSIVWHFIKAPGEQT
ncbi:MAG TPA: class I SAM-dependent methyltransferase [Marinagarivorans sp.]